MKLKLLLLIIVLFTLQIVNAQYYYDSSYNNAFFPNFGLFSFSIPSLLDFYNSGSNGIDFFIVLFLLAGLLSKIFEDKFGKSTPIALSLILSLGFLGLETKIGFNFLTLFGPIVLLLLFLLVLFGVLYLVHLIHKKFNEHKKTSIVGSILLAIVLIIIFWSFIKELFSGFGISLPSLPIPGIENLPVAPGWFLIIVFLLFLTYILYLYNKDSKGTSGPEVIEPDRSRWFRGGRGRTTPPEQEPIPRPGSHSTPNSESPNIPQYAPPQARNKEEEREYKRLVVLIADFLSMPEDVIRGATTRQHFEERYKAVLAAIKEFLDKYILISKNKDRVFKAQKEVDRVYEETIAKLEEVKLLTHKPEEHDNIEELIDIQIGKINDVLKNPKKYDYGRKVDIFQEANKLRENYKQKENRNEQKYKRLIKLIIQLKEAIDFNGKEEQVKEVQQETKKPKAFEVLSDIIKRLKLANLNINQLPLEELKVLVNEAESILERCKNPGNAQEIYITIESIENNLIKPLKAKIAELEAPKLLTDDINRKSGLFNKLSQGQSFFKNISEFNKIKKGAELFINLLRTEIKNKDEAKQRYLELIKKLDDFNKSSGRSHDDNIIELKNELSLEMNLLEDKINLQNLIDDLNLFITRMSRGEVNLKSVGQKYSISRKIFSQINETNREQLQEGFNIAYNLINTIYKYLMEMSNLVAIEGQIDKLRKNIREGIISRDTAQEEKNNLIPKLQNLVTNFNPTNIKKRSLLGELTSGI